MSWVRHAMAWLGDMSNDQTADIPRYGGWASLYARYRPGYPEAVFALLDEALVGREFCVDLGAGTGQATRDLASRFSRTLAVEPDPDMAARIPAYPGVEVRVARAEDIALPSGAADAVVAATALHWMNTPRVLASAAQWLKPGGVLLVCAYSNARFPGASAAVADVVRRYARQWRPHTHERLYAWRPAEDLIAECDRFSDVRPFEVFVDYRWSAAQAAGYLMTTSFSQSFAEHAGGAEQCLDDLARELAAASGGDDLVVRFPVEGARALRA